MQALVNLVSGALVAAEANDGELGLNHARLNLRHADGRVDNLAQERTSEGAHSVLRGTVYRTTSIWLAACHPEVNIGVRIPEVNGTRTSNRANVDDVSSLARLEI